MNLAHTKKIAYFRVRYACVLLKVDKNNASASHLKLTVVLFRKTDQNIDDIILYAEVYTIFFCTNRPFLN